jgi:hypothetical protein
MVFIVWVGPLLGGDQHGQMPGSVGGERRHEEDLRNAHHFTGLFNPSSTKGNFVAVIQAILTSST